MDDEIKCLRCKKKLSRYLFREPGDICNDCLNKEKKKENTLKSETDELNNSDNEIKNSEGDF